ERRGCRGGVADRRGARRERTGSFQRATAQLHDVTGARDARAAACAAVAACAADRTLVAGPQLAHQGFPCTGRPQPSGQPSTRFRFWIAWPAAPFTRLSMAEVASSVRPPCTV